MAIKPRFKGVSNMKEFDKWEKVYDVLAIIDKYKAESEGKNDKSRTI
jgi:hypothetical protein